MATMSQDRTLAAPIAYPEAQAFWDAAGEGRLLVKTCNACGERHHYPRTFCPFCFSDDTAWIESGGQGVIYSYSVTRRGTPTPYCIAYVTLDEGPTMMTNIVDCDLDQVRIGQRVQVVFKPTGDASGSTPPVAMFRPV